MSNISIDLSDNTSKLSTFANKIEAEVITSQNEELIAVNNSLATGTVRFNNFDNGISVISFDIFFSEEVMFSVDNEVGSPTFLIHSSQGQLLYSKNNKEDLSINNYQNIIIGATNHNNYCFKVQTTAPLKTNIITIDNKKFLNNRSSFSFLEEETFGEIFEVKKNPFLHFGTYSLKIEEKLHKVRNTSYKREDLQAIKTQGHIFLVLALHFAEFNKVSQKHKSFENLEEKDILIIKELTAYIENNIDENITVSTLVSKSGIHAKKLQLGFRLLYNKSINEYIRELKLKIALHSLENTNESISEIVYKIGFKSRSYFSKIFLAHYGILPVDYKRKMNKSKSK